MKRAQDENEQHVAGKLPRDPREGTETVSLIPGFFQLTDFGNAERFVARFRDRVRYCQQRRKWLVWAATHWKWDDSGEVLRLAKTTVRKIYEEAADCTDKEQRAAISQHARRSESVARLDAIVKLAQSEADIPVTVAELDADPWALNCENGTVDLRTGALRCHERSDLLTKTTGLRFEPSARSELWDRVLLDTTGADTELAGYLQRVAGYALIGEPLERVFFFLFGPPGTAKSTVVLALHAALGAYAQSAAFETWLLQSNVGGNRGDLVRLAGARLVTSVEVRHGARWDEALVKSITGGDQIVASAKFESEVQFTPSFTLLLAANDSPTVREDDDGLWKRMRRIPLTAAIPPERQDPTVKVRLREPDHAAAVLAWAVAGCVAYQASGLGTCAAVEASTAEYRSEMDHFAEFLGDACLFEEGAQLARRALREAYRDWAEETGRRALLGSREIARRLRDRKCDERILHGVRQWVGVRLRTVTDPGVQMGLQGADRCSTPREVITNQSSRETLGNDAPKCTQVNLGFSDDIEREAIQGERN